MTVGEVAEAVRHARQHSAALGEQVPVPVAGALVLAVDEAQRLESREQRHQLGGVAVEVRMALVALGAGDDRSEEHTSELQSLMRSSYAVFCLKKKSTRTSEEKSYKITTQ